MFAQQQHFGNSRATIKDRDGYLEWVEDAVVVLGVLPDPGVTVVYVGGGDVLVHHLRHHHKPFGQEVSLSKEGSTCTNI